MTEKKSASFVKFVFLAFYWRLFEEHPNAVGFFIFSFFSSLLDSKTSGSESPLAHVFFLLLLLLFFLLLLLLFSVLIWDNTEIPFLYTVADWFGGASLVVHFFLEVILFQKLSADPYNYRLTLITIGQSLQTHFIQFWAL